jgi:hypothetical protein
MSPKRASGATRLQVLKPSKLDAERLFREQFLPLYPPGVSLEAVRKTDANPANNPAILSAIEETAALFAQLAPEALAAPHLDLDFSDASIHRLAARLDAAARDRLFETRTAPGEPPLFVHFVIHGSLYVGACVVKTRGARWLVRNPLWETRVELTSKAGVAELSPFSWWLRALSDDEIGKGTLADRYRTHVEEPTLDVENWPVFLDPGRRLPRLSRPRYDLLVQYLQTHLPEVRDLGDHFPSPQRFEELGFRWLEPRILGAGRALLLHGPGERGVHLFWITKAGFIKAVFFEADAAPEHRVRSDRTTDGTEKLIVEASHAGASIRHEMLWWGM